MTESLLEYESPSAAQYASVKEKVRSVKARVDHPDIVSRYRKVLYSPDRHQCKWQVTLRNSGTTFLRKSRPPARSKIQHTPVGLMPVIDRLFELLELPHGWNSYNAKPVSKENAKVAVGILGRVMSADTPAPIVVPMVRGGVQLEWHTGGIDLEISIYSPDEIIICVEDAGGESMDGRFDERVATEWIGRLGR